MRYRSLLSAAALAFVVASVPLTVVSVSGQQAPQAQAPAAAPAAAAKPYVIPGASWTPAKTPWGDPDFQGVWDYQSRIPMQRPPQLKGKTHFTEQELIEWAKQGNPNQDPCGVNTRAEEDCSLQELASVGAYNEFWNNRNVVTDYRTSLIEDPPDGRIPPLTPEAQARQREITGPRAAGRSRYETFTDYTAVERCIGEQTPNGPQMYNSGVLWQQSPGWIVMYRERMDTRIIPLDGRPHVDSNIRQWNGNSVGRFEGNVLVVTTTNFTDKQNRGGVGSTVPAGLPFGNFKLTERWVPVSPTRLNYYATLEDPTTWVRPWTFMLPWERDPSYQLFEFACNEGNIAIGNSLRGERELEREAATKPKLAPELTSAGLVGLTGAQIRAKLGEPAEAAFNGSRLTYKTTTGSLVLNLFLEKDQVKIAQPNDLPLELIVKK
jgi:hypothetical protein